MSHLARRRFALAGVSAVVSLAAAGGASASLVQTPVLTAGVSEEDPAVSGDYLVWDQNSAGQKKHFNAFMRFNGVTTRLNPIGTRAWSGGIDGTTIVYQQANAAATQSSIMMFDAVTHKRSAPPAGVNKPSWEFNPTISGNWLLFGRQSGQHYRRSQVILRSLTSKTSFVLADVSTSGYVVYPGQVNGNWVVWGRCGPSSCSVYRRNIATRVSNKLVNTLQRDKYEFDPAVAVNGTAYYVHSGQYCGQRVRLVKHGVGTPETVLTGFNNGVGLGQLTAAPNPVSGTDVYFTKIRCALNSSDVYKVLDP